MPATAADIQRARGVLQQIRERKDAMRERINALRLKVQSHKNAEAAELASAVAAGQTPEQGLDRAAELFTGQPGVVSADFALAEAPPVPLQTDIPPTISPEAEKMASIFDRRDRQKSFESMTATSARLQPYMPPEPPPERGEGTIGVGPGPEQPKIGAQPDEVSILSQIQDWIAPEEPGVTGRSGLEVMSRNLGADKIIGGVIGAFAEAGKSVVDLVAVFERGRTGKMPSLKEMKDATVGVLEQAKGFAEFPVHQLKNAAIIVGLGPDGWNPHYEIASRKLSGDPMRLEEVSEKYPAYAKAAEELIAFPAGPVMALSMVRHVIAGKPGAFKRDLKAVGEGKFEARGGFEKPLTDVSDIQKPTGDFTTEVPQSQPISRPAGRVIEPVETPVAPPAQRIPAKAEKAPVTPDLVKTAKPPGRQALDDARGVKEKIAPVEPPKPPAPPKVKGVEVAPPEKAAGLNKVEIAEIRERTPLGKMAEVNRRTWEEVLHTAKREKANESALSTAKSVLESDRMVTDVEHAGMVIKRIELDKAYDTAIADASKLVDAGDTFALRAARKESNAILAEIETLVEASQKTGRESARALAMRRSMLGTETYTLAKVMQRAKVSKGRPLTEVETVRVEKLVETVRKQEKVIKEAETREAEWLNDREKVIAERIAAHEKTKGRIQGRKKSAIEKLDAEQLNLEKELADLGLTTRMGLDPRVAFALGKYTVNVIRKGAVTLEAAVKTVKAKFPELIDSDIYEAIAARDPKRQAKARSEVQKRVAELTKQGKLRNKIELAESGIFGKPEGKPIASGEIKALRRTLENIRQQAYRSVTDAGKHERIVKTINELQDQLANQYRTVRKGKRIDTAEIASAKAKLADLRKRLRVKDQLADLSEQLRTGEFVIVEKPKAIPMSPQLEMGRIKLKRTKDQISAAIERMAPLTAGKFYKETANLLRTLRATADMSAVMRQGIIMSVSNPKAFPKAFGTSAKSFFDKYTAEQADLAIRSHPNYYLAERAKLELTEVGSKLGRSEEMFSSQWAEQIPGWKHVVAASERHMTTFLNMMRMEHFNRFIELHPNATRVELKVMADWINVASGRGNFGKFASLSKGLSAFLFAPKFALSRIQAPFYGFKKGTPKRVRQQIFKDQAKMAAFGLTTLIMAKAAGADLTLDPDSPDFGKARFGPTRVDFFGGIQQPMRLWTRIITGAFNRYEDVDPMELAGRFFSYKAGPIVGMPIEFLRGKTIVGEDRKAWETALAAVTPLVVEDVWDALQVSGEEAAAYTGAAVFFGIGVQSYKDSEYATRRWAKEKIKEVASEKNSAKARAIRTEMYTRLREWNRNNPKNKIMKP